VESKIECFCISLLLLPYNIAADLDRMKKEEKKQRLNQRPSKMRALSINSAL
jgi:hypothetical protein